MVSTSTASPEPSTPSPPPPRWRGFSSVPATTGSRAATAARRSRTSTASAKKTPPAPSRLPWTPTSRRSCSAKTGHPPPFEYVLHALAACLTGTIAYHAAARGIAVDGLETTIQGDLDLHGFLGLDSNVRPGYEQVRVTIKATGDFDDNQLAELASLTRYSPVRDIVSNPVPVAIDLARA